MTIPYRIGRALTRVVSRFLFRVRVRGVEHIPPSGGFILACNHISYCDPPFVGSWSNRELYFLTKKELFDIPLFGLLLRSLNTIPLKREGIDRRAIELGIDAIKRGCGLVIFPEGTRSRSGELRAGRAGVGAIARAAGCPVVPAYVHGTNRLTRCLVRNRRLSVTYGEPISADWVLSQSSDKSGFQAIADEVMARIRALKGILENPKQD